MRTYSGKITNKCVYDILLIQFILLFMCGSIIVDFFFVGTLLSFIICNKKNCIHKNLTIFMKVEDLT